MKELQLGIKIPMSQENFDALVKALKTVPVADETPTQEENADADAVWEAYQAGIYLTLTEEGDMVPGVETNIDPSQN